MGSRTSRMNAISSSSSSPTTDDVVDLGVLDGADLVLLETDERLWFGTGALSLENDSLLEVVPLRGLVGPPCRGRRLCENSIVPPLSLLSTDFDFVVADTGDGDENDALWVLLVTRRANSMVSDSQGRDGGLALSQGTRD